jgi:hypothetical protein
MSTNSKRRIIMNINSLKKLTLAFAVILAVAALGANASAETLLAFATRANNASDVTTHVAVPLDDNNAPSLSFKTTAANKLIKITYNAECAVGGPAGSWLSVTILVDGVEADPKSGTFFGFCTANGSFLQYTGTVRQSLIKVPTAGTHNIQIIVDLNGATQWWLGDTSLVVEQK